MVDAGRRKFLGGAGFAAAGAAVSTIAPKQAKAAPWPRIIAVRWAC